MGHSDMDKIKEEHKVCLGLKIKGFPKNSLKMKSAYLEKCWKTILILREVLELHVYTIFCSKIKTDNLFLNQNICCGYS